MAVLHGPMPSSAVVEATVDGAAIAPEDGPFLDTDGYSQPGGVLTYSFSTVSVEPLPNTTLAGIIVDPGPDTEPMTDDDFNAGVFLFPIAGVEVTGRHGRHGRQRRVRPRPGAGRRGQARSEWG